MFDLCFYAFPVLPLLISHFYLALIHPLLLYRSPVSSLFSFNSVSSFQLFWSFYSSLSQQEFVSYLRFSSPPPPLVAASLLLNISFPHSLRLLLFSTFFNSPPPCTSTSHSASYLQRHPGRLPHISSSIVPSLLRSVRAGATLF